MNQFLYFVYDSVAEATSGPVIMQASHAVARRMFSDLVLSDGSHVGKHAADFSIICVGSVDTLTGLLTPFASPETLLTATAVLEFAARSASAES